MRCTEMAEYAPHSIITGHCAAFPVSVSLTLSLSFPCLSFSPSLTVLLLLHRASAILTLEAAAVQRRKQRMGWERETGGSGLMHRQSLIQPYFSLPFPASFLSLPLHRQSFDCSLHTPTASALSHRHFIHRKKNPEKAFARRIAHTACTADPFDHQCCTVCWQRTHTHTH